MQQAGALIEFAMPCLWVYVSGKSNEPDPQFLCGARDCCGGLAVAWLRLAGPTPPAQSRLGRHSMLSAARHATARILKAAEMESLLPSGRLPAPPHDHVHHPDGVLYPITKDGP